jgi:uncharacterized protein YegJ (DUF2314 family)
MSFAKSASQFGLIIGLGLVGYVGFNTLSTALDPGPDENIMTIATENAQMIAAEASAVDTRPRFLEMAATNPSGWSPITLKVGMQGTDMIENIWVGDISNIGDGSFAGRLANDPMALAGLKMGSRVVFEENQISDWAVMINERGYGYYSVRAIAELVSEEEAEQLMSFLSSDPLPPGF